MKEYKLSTIFTFGKHKNKSIEDVLKINDGYIEWCIIHLDHFLIDDGTLSQIKISYPEIKFSEQAIATLTLKQEKYYDELEDMEWANYGKTKEKYRGTYAQDEAGLSDDFIDDVLDGDPSNYWNID